MPHITYPPGVLGPVLSTNNAMVRWDGTSGRAVQDSANGPIGDDDGSLAVGGTGSTAVASAAGVGAGDYFGLGPVIATDIVDDESSGNRYFGNDTAGPDFGLIARVADDGTVTLLTGDGTGSPFTSIAFALDGSISIGAAATLNGGFIISPQTAPAAYNTSSTLDPADLIAGLIKTTSATAVALTLPTGSDMDDALLGGGLSADNAFFWSSINLGSAVGVMTLTANTDHTIVGNPLVPIAAATVSGSATWRTRKVDTGVFETYRIS